MHLNGLVPDRLHTLNLFEGTEDEQSRTRIVAAMDVLNNNHGLSTLAPATMLTAFKAAPTRIAFHTIPELFWAPAVAVPAQRLRMPSHC